MAESPLLDREADSEKVLKECATLEAEMASLRARYDQYFLGMERSKPTVAHNALRRKIEAMTLALAKTTVVRWKIQNLHHRWQSYERQWIRIAQERENGTYHRDLFKARLHAKKKT
jgi:hypothetical protein